MNILMVHPHEVYSRIEPWTVRIVSFAKELSKRNHRVKVVYFPLDWKSSSGNFRKENIDFIAFNRRAGMLNILSNCLRLSALAKWADIIHFQKCFHYASLPSLISGFLRDKPLHYDWDDWEEMIYYESASPPLKGVGVFLRILERIIPTLVDTISVSSKRLYEICRGLGVDSDRIFYASVGADTQKFSPSVSGERIRRKYNISNPLVLYVGQLHGGQYVKLFIEAARIILDKGIEADFMIVGDGVRGQELRQKAKELYLENKIIFTGAVDSENIPEYIACCDVAVACFEDNEVTRCKSPLKITEYMASGKPIVASNVGEVERMLFDAGIVVPPGDPVQIANEIIKLISHKGLGGELGRKARRRAENIYNWGTSSENLLKAYNAAIKLKNRVL